MSDAVQQSEQVPSPPTDVAGLEALDNEPDENPMLDVRGRSFRLRSVLPSMLIGRLNKTAESARGLLGKEFKDLTPSQADRFQSAVAASYDALIKMVVEDDRQDFVSWCEDVEPPINSTEQAELLRTAVETIVGRPTGAS